MFVQSNCLQGEKFSAYLLWEKKDNIEIDIELSDTLSIDEINNVEPKDVITNGNKIQLKSFKENGYLGIIVGTKTLPEYSVNKTIIFRILDSRGNVNSISKTVHLFRPELEITNKPKVISVKMGTDDNISIDNNFKFYNKGEGIAIIGLEAEKDSDCQIELPENIGEFFIGLEKDIRAGLPKIKERYPNMKPFIEEGETLLSPEKDRGILERQEVAKKLAQELNEFDVTYPEFASEYRGFIINALLNNFRGFILQFEGFLDYISLINAKKIAFIDPINVIEVKAGKNRFKGNLIITDRAFMESKSIPIDFELEANKNVKIPIYRLFG